MAVTWLEKNETKVTSNQWGEDIYGLKATNVFGLAWNYYVGYTKFITGLDLTLDMGMKTEFFFAGTIKIGYANELKSIGNQKTGVTSILTSISNTFESLCQSSTRVTQEENEVHETLNEDIENRNAFIGTDEVERGSYSSITSGVENRESSELTETSDSIMINATGTASVNGGGELSLDAGAIFIG